MKINYNEQKHELPFILCLIDAQTISELGEVDGMSPLEMASTLVSVSLILAGRDSLFILQYLMEVDGLSPYAIASIFTVLDHSRGEIFKAVEILDTFSIGGHSSDCACDMCAGMASEVQ